MKMEELLKEQRRENNLTTLRFYVRQACRSEGLYPDADELKEIDVSTLIDWLTMYRDSLFN